MIYFLLRLIQLILPYGIILLLYKYNNALPANIKTRSGRFMKAIMITENYGILVSSQRYEAEKGKKLLQEQEKLNKKSEMLAKEFNKLSFDLREEMFNKENEET